MQQEKSNQPEPKSVSIADIFFRSRELEQLGEKVIHLDVGEPDYEPPTQVVEETKRALELGRGRYTHPGGIIEVRRAIADHVNSTHRVSISPKQVIFTTGGRMALFLAFASLPRDSTVGVISPDWPAYRDLCDFLSLKTKHFKTKLEDSWIPDLGEIEDCKCDALVINYPNNPTGKMLEPKFFAELFELANRRGMKIVSDEVYSDFLFSEGKFKSILDLEAPFGTIFTTSLSKSYSMTGFRAAYLISDEETVSKLTQMNALLLTSAPEFVQYGAIAAMNQEEYVSSKVKIILERMHSACKALKELGAKFYFPDGSFYIFPKFQSGSGKPIDSVKFSMDLLEIERVSVTPGAVFGPSYNEYVRLTVLETENNIIEGIRRIARFLG